MNHTTTQESSSSAVSMELIDPVRLNGSYDSQQQFQTRLKFYTGILWIFFATIGIPGNLLVLGAILKSSKLKTVSHVLIFNLSLADLLFLLGIPIIIWHAVEGVWIFGIVVCKVFLTFNGINQFASATFLGFLSLDRYLAVCHPFSSRKLRTPKIACAVSITCWSLMTVEMAPILMFGTLIEDPFSKATQCMIYWNMGRSFDLDLNATGNTTDIKAQIEAQITRYYHELGFNRMIFTLYSFVLSYLIPMVCMWFFYGRIIYRLWCQHRLFHQTGSGHGRRTTKVTIMGLAVITAYTLCWSPFWFVQWSIEINASWTRDKFLVLPISYFAYLCQYLNSALNPFLYAFLTDTFRDVLKTGIRSQFTQSKESRFSKSTTKYNHRRLKADQKASLKPFLKRFPSLSKRCPVKDEDPSRQRSFTADSTGTIRAPKIGESNGHGRMRSLTVDSNTSYSIPAFTDSATRPQKIGKTTSVAIVHNHPAVQRVRSKACTIDLCPDTSV